MLGQLSGAKSRLSAIRYSTRTKDTLVFIDGDTLLIKPFIPKEVYRVSPYVFTGKYGNIHVTLPGAQPKEHYAVQFFDENNKLLV